MHVLHTTPAFVLARYEHGEASYVYKLFTRELGILYVHGQGVREVRNRNRYALSTHHRAEVTVVRGRGVWRLTGAGAGVRTRTLAPRRALSLAGSLLPQEDPAPTLFDLLCAECTDVTLVPHDAGETYEALLALKVLHELGYVARPTSSLTDEVLASDESLHALATRFAPRRSALVAAVNSALEHTHRGRGWDR